MQTTKTSAPFYEEAKKVKEVNFLQSEEQDACSTPTDEVHVDRQNPNREFM